MGFPRRFGIQFDADYVKKSASQVNYVSGQFIKIRTLQNVMKVVLMNTKSNRGFKLIWAHFAGIFENDETYLKLSIETNGTIVKEFFFKFIKGYQTYNSITYVVDPITKKKKVSGGLLLELDPKTKEPKISISL